MSTKLSSGVVMLATMAGIANAKIVRLRELFCTAAIPHEVADQCCINKQTEKLRITFGNRAYCLVRKTMRAAKDHQVRTIVAAGGVACNAELRRMLAAKLPRNVALKIAKPVFCTDNAAMVGGIAWHSFRRGEFASLDIDSFARLPRFVRVPFI